MMVDEREAVPVEIQQANDYSSYVQASSINRALNLVGDRTALLVIYCLFLGIKRFSAIQAHTGISRSVLNNRLRQLEDNGLLTRREYQQRPQRFDYRLTAMSRDLYDVALALIRWDKVWHYDADCLTHGLIHLDCGREFTPQLNCGGCDEAVDPHDVEWRIGPGHGVDPHPGNNRTRRTSLSREQLAGRHSILGRSLEIMGDRWTAQVIAAAFFRVHHFVDFQQGLGIAPNILSDRLERLLEMDILQRKGSAKRPSYHLTPSGLDIYPIIVALMRWGDRWLDDGRGVPLLLKHVSCQRPFEPQMVCSECQGRLEYLNFQLPDDKKP